MKKTKNEKLEQFLNDGNFIYLEYYSEQEMVITNGNISFLENQKEFQSVRVMNRFMNELFYSDKYDKNVAIEKAEQFVLSIMENEDEYLKLIYSWQNQILQNEKEFIWGDRKNDCKATNGTIHLEYWKRKG